MRDDEPKSSAEIERDVEARRARLEHTLGDIRERMTAGQIVDEVFAYAKTSGGGEIVHNLGRSIRENPLPLLLMGAGIGWMMLGGGGPARRDWGPYEGEDYGQGRWAGWENGHRGPPVSGAYAGGGSSGSYSPEGGYPADGGSGEGGPGMVGRVGEAVGHAASAAYHGVVDAAQGVAGAVGSAAEAVGSAAQAAGRAGAYVGRMAGGAADAAGRAASYAERTAGGVGDAAGRAGHYADHMAHRAGDLAGSMRGEAEHMGQAARDGWRYLAQEQPLVLAAIGVALGAAVGAMIPSTGIENRAMGESAEEVKRTVGDVASRQVDRAKELVEDTVQAVSEELDRGHLTETAVGAIDAVADRVREVVQPADEGSDDQASNDQQANDQQSYGGSDAGRTDQGGPRTV